MVCVCFALSIFSIGYKQKTIEKEEVGEEEEGHVEFPLTFFALLL